MMLLMLLMLDDDDADDGQRPMMSCNLLCSSFSGLALGC